MTSFPGGWLLWLLVLSPMWGALLAHLWQGSVRPQLIPTREIEKLADMMIASFAARAEEMASIEEDRAGRYSDPFAQARWRRVREAIEEKRQLEIRLSLVGCPSSGLSGHLLPAGGEKEKGATHPPSSALL